MKKLLSVVLVLTISIALHATQTFYVTTYGSSSNDGKSWENAISSLSSAISAASSVASNSNKVEIWVAKGTYEISSLELKDNISIYGGFDGTESGKGNRKFGNETTLRIIGLYGVCSKDVSNSTIDSFIISGGSYSIYNVNSPVTISNCTILNSSSVAIYNTNSNVLIENCTITNNEIAICNAFDGTHWTNAIKIRNCTIANNNGAGVYNNEYARPEIENCIIWGNYSSIINLATPERLPDVKYCIVEGGFVVDGVERGQYTISENPLLGPLDNYGGSVKTFPVCFGSPAIGKGSNSGPSYDARGIKRIFPCTIGAFQYDHNNTEDILPSATNIDLRCAYTVGKSYNLILNADSDTGTNLTYILYGSDGTEFTSAFGKINLIPYERKIVSYKLGVKANIGGKERLVNLKSEIVRHVKGNIIYVSKNGNNSNIGDSWDNALSDIQLAINIAADLGKDGEPAYVWIAQGEYYVNPITMRNNVEIYGGFKGTETKLEERNNVNESVVTTLIPVNQTKYVINNNSNLIGNSAKIDSVTIKGGVRNSYSSPTISNCNIEGFYIYTIYNDYSASPIITNCILKGNCYPGVINKGGAKPLISDCYVTVGIKADSSAPTIKNCNITKIYTGISCENGSNAVITDCTIKGESDYENYPAIYIDSSSPIISNCTISQNNANSIYIQSNSSPTIQDCIISKNKHSIYIDSSAPTISKCKIIEMAGNGIQCKNGSNAVIKDCTLQGNSTSNEGKCPTIWIENSSPFITSCTFLKNNSDGIYNQSAYPTITNCTITENGGDGIDNRESSLPIITNCTITGNDGYGIYNNSSTPTIKNSIIWGNKKNEIGNYESAPIISYSVIQGGYKNGSNIITADPLLGEIGDYGGNVLSIPVFIGSSAIGNGTSAWDTTTDTRGIVRTNPPTIGAFEPVFKGEPSIVYCAIKETIISTGKVTQLVVQNDGEVVQYVFYKNGIEIARKDVNTIDIKSNEKATYSVGVIYGNKEYKSDVKEFIPKPYVVYYVSTSGKDSNDGKSWDNSFASLQNAIDTAAMNNAPAQIWVAQGTYFLGKSYIIMRNNVEVYGGFSGTETSLEEKNGQLKTILNATGSYGIYSAHLDNSAIIEGVTITNHNGCGIHNTNSSLIIANCTITANDGYGIYNIISNPTITNCTITENGEYGIYNYSSNPTITNCTITENDGDGIYNNDSSNPTITNCTITENSSYGIYNYSSSNPTITNCTITENDGDGINNYNSSNPTITNCTITENGDNGIRNSSSSPTITNCTIAENSYYGIYNTSSSPTITNCTIAENSYYGIYNTSSSPTITNCIIWGNTGDEIYNTSSSPIISYCVVEGGYADGTNIITEDPLLGKIGNYGGYVQTMPVLKGSSAIGAGATGEGIPTTDARGTTRSTSPTIGAYEASLMEPTFVWDNIGGYIVVGKETQITVYCDGNPSEYILYRDGEEIARQTSNIFTITPEKGGLYNYSSGAIYDGKVIKSASQTQIRHIVGNIIYVSTNGDNNNSGDSWENALADVQTAIDAASAFATDVQVWQVWIAKGTYGGIIKMRNNVEIYGGFAGTEENLEERTSGNETILTTTGYYVIYNRYTEESPLTSSSKLDGVTITGASGYGIYNDESNPTITNCTITENGNYGIVNNSSSPTITNCTIAQNSSSGIYNYSSSNPTITNCTMMKNRGDGICNLYSSPTITNCTITMNRGSDAYGVSNYASSPTIRNCIIWKNIGDEIYNSSLSDGTTWDSSNPVVSYSVVEGGYTNGTNIITEDPLLGKLGNYGGSVQTIPVSKGSSAIGKGVSGDAIPTTDARGKKRSNPPTIGAYEGHYLIFTLSVDTKKPLMVNTAYALTLDSDIEPEEYILYKDGIEVARQRENVFEIISNEEGTYSYYVCANHNGTEIKSNSTKFTFVVPKIDLQIDYNTLPLGRSYKLTAESNIPVTEYVLYRDGVEIARQTENIFEISSNVEGAFSYSVGAIYHSVEIKSENKDISFIVPQVTYLSEGGTLGIKNAHFISVETNVTPTEYILYENGVEIARQAENTFEINSSNATTVSYSIGFIFAGVEVKSDTINVTYRNILYVSTDGNDDNDGKSWNTALATIQKAIDKSGSVNGTPTLILVKAGTYSIANYIRMKSFIEIYGGFEGFEATLKERKNDIISELTGDNSIMICNNVNQAKIDGFIFSNGSRGIQSSRSDFIIENCILKNNRSCAIYDQYSNITIRNSSIIGIGNSTGVSLESENAVLENCSIAGNQKGLQVIGGTCKIYNCAVFNNNYGICNSSPKLEIKKCSITDNEVNGIYNYFDSTSLTDILISDCAIANNGIGIHNNKASPVIENSSIYNNVEYGIYNNSSSSIAKNCTITENGIDGIFSSDDSSQTITNCTITKNNRYGIRNESSTSIITNCTIVNNSGYELFIDNETSSSSITNSIIWGSSSSEIYIGNTNSQPIVSHCIVKGGCSDGTNIIKEDPLLGVLGNYGGVVQTIPVLKKSPAINKGIINDNVPTTDARGIKRLNLPTIGAFEPIMVTLTLSSGSNILTLETPFKLIANTNAETNTYILYKDGIEIVRQSENVFDITSNNAGDVVYSIGIIDNIGNEIQSTSLSVKYIDSNFYIYHVTQDGNDANDGLSWNTSFSEIQKAIDVASIVATDEKPAQVWIAKGIYNVSKIKMKPNVEIYGGFEGTEAAVSERKTGNETILTAIGSTVINNEYTKDNPLILSAKLDSVIITSASHGISNNNASPLITNCTITNITNTAISNSNSSSPLITNCTIVRNGSGVYNSSSSPSIINCTIAENNGRALDNSLSSPIVTNCIIWKNGTDEIYNTSSSSPIFSNCVIYGGYDNGINIITEDPKLGELGNYGGFVPTIPTLIGSSAIRMGGIGDRIPSTDARGMERANPPTIGAFEASLKKPSAVNCYAPIKAKNGEAMQIIAQSDGTPMQFVLYKNGEEILRQDSSIFEIQAEDIGNIKYVIGVIYNNEEYRSSEKAVLQWDYDIYFVSPNGDDSNNGKTWETAFASPQKAIDIAASANVVASQVWIANGIYYNAGGNDSFDSFVLRPNIEVYGGFNGTETKLEERIPENETILTTTGDYVFYNDASKILKIDSVIIKGAKKSGIYSQNCSSIIINNCMIVENNDSGIYHNCVEDSEVSRCVISKNGSYGVYTYLSSGDFIYSKIAENNAGGAYIDLFSAYTIKNCTINGNDKFGITISESSTVRITDCSIFKNAGNGIESHQSSTLYATNCAITNNNFNGLYSTYSSNSELTNCTIFKNEESGISLEESSSSYLMNLTILGNKGYGLKASTSANIKCKNSIIWENINEEIKIESGSQISISYSIVNGGYEKGENIITEDPLFGEIGNYGGVIDTIPVLEGSPAIKSGTSEGINYYDIYIIPVPTRDARGIIRGTPCTIGAYEYFPESKFDSWAIDNSLTGDNAKPEAKPFNDGITNLEKFVFGLPANKPTSYAENANFKQTNDGITATFQFPLNKDVSLATNIKSATSGATVKVLVSEDLVNWTETTATQSGESGNLNLYKVETPIPGSGKLFFRVEASQE